LSFRVYDENELNNQQALFIAYSAVPLLNLRRGLRSLMLYDEKGNRKGDFEFCSLLIRVKIENLKDMNNIGDLSSSEVESLSQTNNEDMDQENCKILQLESLSRRKQINLSIDTVT